MSNSFDFELVADDKVSGAIERINESLNDLQPKLDKTRAGLQLGGQETLDGLNGYNSRLELMAQSARDNVQYIGDMVPPLKMVGDITGKLEKMAKIGLVGGAIGGVAYATGKLAESYREASREAYNLDVSSKNAGMRVDDFSRLAGALRFVGADSESASSSIEGFAKALKEASSGSNQGMMAAFATIGVQIQKNKNGSVDTLKTLQEIARVFPKFRPEQQKSIADSLGLTPEMLALMREGERMKTLLVKSDKVGLTVDPSLNQQLTDFNSAINEASASWDGFKARVERKIYSYLDNKGITDTVQGASDMLTNNFDNISIGRFSGQNKGDDSILMRRALNDPNFIKLLDGNEKNQLTAGVMTEQSRNKYHQYFYNQDRSQQLQDDISAITSYQTSTVRADIPYNQEKNNSRGLRNRNPGNVRDAPNSLGKNGGFSVFKNDNDGLSALARQLMLYGDRGNNTPNGIIHTYAPNSENNTKAYVNSIAKTTGFQPHQRLNLHDPDILKPLMAAIIKHEGGTQPFSEAQISNAIRTAIMDDRWKGLRRSEILNQQRNNLSLDDNSIAKRDIPAVVAQPPAVVPYREDRTKLDMVEHGIERSNATPSVSDVAKRGLSIPEGRATEPVKPMADIAKREDSTPVIQPAQVPYNSVNTSQTTHLPVTSIPDKRNISMFTDPQTKTNERSMADMLARSLKDVMPDQKVKLEITMVNDKGERKTYDVENNGRITTPLSY